MKQNGWDACWNERDKMTAPFLLLWFVLYFDSKHKWGKWMFGRQDWLLWILWSKFRNSLVCIMMGGGTPNRENSAHSLRYIKSRTSSIKKNSYSFDLVRRNWWYSEWKEIQKNYEARTKHELELKKQVKSRKCHSAEWEIEWEIIVPDKQDH